jgi:hypothetical protein
MKPRQPIHPDMVPIPADNFPEDKRGYKRLFFVLHSNLFFREEVFLVVLRSIILGFNVANI